MTLIYIILKMISAIITFISLVIIFPFKIITDNIDYLAEKINIKFLKRDL